MTKQQVQRMKSLIASGSLGKFYSSYEWQQLAARAREEQHNECQRCKANGWYSPCGAVHHIKPVKQHPELALSIENLMCLCRDCHDEIHQVRGATDSKNQRQGFTNEERW